MEYIQINADGSFGRILETNIPIEWDASHYCEVSKLTPEETSLFRVTTTVEVAKPTVSFDKTVVRDGAINVGGLWLQKWKILAKSESEIAEVRNSIIELKTNLIKAERDRRKFNGVKVNGKWIHTDTYSRTQWMALIMDRMLLGVAMQPIPWTTMDGSIVPTTIELATAVFTATKTLDVLAFSRAAFHIAQVEASADPAGYDFSAGWPETFGE